MDTSAGNNMELPPKRNRSLVQQYVFEEQLSGCELFHHIEGETWDKVRAAWNNPNPDCLYLEPHHIFGGPHRWDIVSNLVAISRPAHDWCHQERQSATILSIWVKMEKGEFDRDLLRSCMGKDPLGEIEYYDVPQWAADIRMGILERF